MSKITKQNIGQIAYCVNYSSGMAEGCFVKCIIDNVSLDGEEVRVRPVCSQSTEEKPSNQVALNGEGLIEIIETIIKNTQGYYVAKADTCGFMSGYCGFVVDELISDKYGDRSTAKSHSNDSFNIKFPYGSGVSHVMEPADIVKYLFQLWGDSALILKYNMDKATDNWEQCPHCGSNNTDYEETEGGGDHERLEYMSCRDCDCNWTNVYEPAKRKERYLDN